ncbi:MULTISPECIES: histone-like nucleoid-structuring protein Lsr2 [Amycolatopsis]|uniref:Lsr2 family protein n=1 Tax=Amycolatopsis bullii TaxID=941987 RepID=A0ABQ3KBS3_9PSEU|nr:Lsr2 family protein [Amycolatopsis bullii]GHG08899.1 Lsr2 family protein [Amycolatopsis bullii]
MAQKVRVEVLDDIDGSEASETVVFALDGVSYEIDLSEENAEALRGEFARYVQAGRRVGGRRVRTALGQAAGAGSRSPGAEGGNSREYNQAVREWAAANGHNVAERGRLSSDLIAAYEAAQSTPVEVAAAKPARERASRK